MDGTARLFEPFEAAVAEEFETLRVAYPPDQSLGYDELVGYVRERLPTEPFVIVAESFSGPLSVRLAAQAPEHLRALVLSATFVASPVPARLMWIGQSAFPLVFRLSPPPFLIRSFLLGGEGSDELVELVRSAITTADPLVLEHRLREIGRVDVRELVPRIDMPVRALVAKEDRLLGKRSDEPLRAVLPKDAVRTLDGPHLLLQTKPREAAAEIRALCDDLG